MVKKSWTRLSTDTFLSSSLFQPKFKPENVQSSFIFRITGSWTCNTPLCKIPDPNNKVQGFPGGPLVKSLPCNAGDTSSIPGPGRSLNAAEQLSHNYWAHVPQRLSPAHLESELHREATTVRSPHTMLENSPHLLQLEKTCTQQSRPGTAKINKS